MFIEKFIGFIIPSKGMGREDEWKQHVCVIQLSLLFPKQQVHRKREKKKKKTKIAGK